MHPRVSVDLNGLVTAKEGKDICLVITQHTGAGALVMKVIWWNVAAGIHVEEWAVALPTGNNRAAYRETEHDPANSNFPGIIGSGELRLTREGILELHQIGQLADGSAAAFHTKLKQVNALPQIPLKRTYPRP